MLIVCEQHENLSSVRPMISIVLIVPGVAVAKIPVRLREHAVLAADLEDFVPARG